MAQVPEIRIPRSGCVECPKTSDCLALKRAPHAGLLSLPTSEYRGPVALV